MSGEPGGGMPGSCSGGIVGGTRGGSFVGGRGPFMGLGGVGLTGIPIRVEKDM